MGTREILIKNEGSRLKPGVSPAYVKTALLSQITVQNIPREGGGIGKTFHIESPNLVLNS
jgi:hypothetical protein